MLMENKQEKGGNKSKEIQGSGLSKWDNNIIFWIQNTKNNKNICLQNIK